MIVKRILRLALGPSFLDPVPEDSNVQKAAETNRAIEQRVFSAETHILHYVGLGMARKRKRGDLSLNEAAKENAMFYLTFGTLGLNSILHWPVAVIRCRIQTFGTAGRIRLGLSLYAGILCSAGREAVKEGLKTAQNYITKGIKSEVIGYLADMGLFLASWFITYPLLESAVAYSLRLEPPPVRDMYSVAYYRANMGLVGEMFVWQLAEDVARIVGKNLLFLAMGPTRPEAIPQLLSSFFADTTCQVLGELLCIPFSTRIYRKVAAKYSSRALPLAAGLNWDALMKAVGVEWLVTWGLVQVHAVASRVLYRGDVL